MGKEELKAPIEQADKRCLAMGKHRHIWVLCAGPCPVVPRLAPSQTGGLPASQTSCVFPFRPCSISHTTAPTHHRSTPFLLWAPERDR